MKRKKRYKHATIGKKKYYFYKIIWEDPCGDAGHADIDEMKKLKPAIMISQAYIFAKDKKHVWTFSSYDTEQAVFSDRNCFQIYNCKNGEDYFVIFLGSGVMSIICE